MIRTYHDTNGNTHALPALNDRGELVTMSRDGDTFERVDHHTERAKRCLDSIASELDPPLVVTGQGDYRSEYAPEPGTQAADVKAVIDGMFRWLVLFAIVVTAGVVLLGAMLALAWAVAWRPV